MLEALSAKGIHRVVGMMSGTSVDGVDAALIELLTDEGIGTMICA